MILSKMIINYGLDVAFENFADNRENRYRTIGSHLSTGIISFRYGDNSCHFPLATKFFIIEFC